MPPAPQSRSCALAVLFALAACGGKPGTSGSAAVAAIEDCAPLYARLEAACKSGKASQIAACFDVDELTVKATGVPASDASAAELSADVKKWAAQPNGDFERLAKLGVDGQVKLVRTRTVAGRTRMLVRAWGNDGIDYYDFDVTLHHETGEPRVADFYTLLSAETMSARLRRALLPELEQRTRGLAKLDDIDKLEVAHTKDIRRIFELIGQNKLAAALLGFARLPKELQAKKHILLARLNAAQASGNDDEFEKTLDHFRKQHPNDAGIDLRAVDWLVKRERLSEALAGLARVKKAVEGDVFVGVLESKLLLTEKKYDEAQELATAALDAEATLDDARFTLMEIALARKQYGKVVDFITELEKRGHSYKPERMVRIPEFADFLNSKEGKAWAATRR